MKQETAIQIVGIVILAIITLFYNPLSADVEGKIIFVSILISSVLFFIIWDIYKLIENNNTKIKLFNDKLRIEERIKRLENINRI